ncbi:ATP-binding protein [Acrocarpospora sp. B8E8]|uniref:sensor histidine kinase n=1 Tax=Acrocarpospora sp. B8E8 TaxID=3153572 RepID=UPI00325D81F0
MVVADDGPGIPDHQRETVEERFARGAQTRNNGSGLGLALVQQQARLHGGTLDLSVSNRGGLAAVLTLPVTTPATRAPR